MNVCDWQKKIFEMIFEVSWDLVGGRGSPISPHGHGRILLMGDFIHLWHGVLDRICRFSGLFFRCYKRFGSYVGGQNSFPM